MPGEVGPLTVLGTGWKGFQGRLAAALAPLTPEQLALPVAPHHWSIGEVAQHIVVNRVWWFHGWLGQGGPELERIAAWDPKEGPVSSPPEPAELVAALEATWAMIEAGLAHWTSAELTAAPTLPADLSEGERRVFGGRTRQWIVWHVLEHELLHAGEISLALGLHGLPTIRPI